MKIKVFEAAILANKLIEIDLEKAQEFADAIVDAFLEVKPYAEEYNNALDALKKEAQGKKPEEVDKLLSAKAFNKISNKEVDVKKVLSREQAKGICKHMKSVGFIDLLYKLTNK